MYLFKKEYYYYHDYMGVGLFLMAWSGVVYCSYDSQHNAESMAVSPAQLRVLNNAKCVPILCYGSNVLHLVSVWLLLFLCTSLFIRNVSISFSKKMGMTFATHSAFLLLLMATLTLRYVFLLLMGTFRRVGYYVVGADKISFLLWIYAWLLHLSSLTKLSSWKGLSVSYFV